jgi:hypothetical protein
MGSYSSLVSLALEEHLQASEWSHLKESAAVDVLVVGSTENLDLGEANLSEEPSGEALECVRGQLHDVLQQ